MVKLLGLLLDFVGHLLFQFPHQPALLLRCDAVDSRETRMAPSNISGNDCGRVDERCGQHIFRTGVTLLTF